MEIYKIVDVSKNNLQMICLDESLHGASPLKKTKPNQNKNVGTCCLLSHLQRYSGFSAVCASGNLTWLILTKLANILWVLIREPLFHWGQLRDSISGCCSLLFTWACLNGLKKYTLYIIKKRQSRRLLSELSMYTPLLKFTEYFKCNLLAHQIRKGSVSELLFLRFVFLT